MRVLCLTLAFLFVAPAQLAAEDLQIRNLQAVESGDRITVRFELAGAFDREDTIKGLESGLPTVFSYYVDLVRYHKNWWDRTLDHVEIEVVATFNSVTREYLFNYRRNGKLVRSETLRDLDGLRARMTSIEEVRLFDPEDHPVGRLKVRVRADVGHDVTWFIIPRTIGTGWSACRIKREGTEQ